MKKAIENLVAFIAEQKAFFEVTVRQHVDFCWEDGRWYSSTSFKSSVFASHARVNLNFNIININIIKGIYSEGDKPFLDKELIIDDLFSDFIKSMATYSIKLSNNKISPQALNRDQLLLKRIYIRMILEGHKTPHPININSSLINLAMTALELSQPNQTQIADSQTAMGKIVKLLNHLSITLNPITFDKSVKRASTKATKNAKKADSVAYHKAKNIEEIDQNEHDKLITINTFLNIVAARNHVTTDSERLMLNMVLLLLITGFRFNEISPLTTDSLKKLYVDDPKVRDILKQKGLPTYYLGIKYLGEKKSGQRTHWVEPLAIPLVEALYESSITISRNLREHIQFCRTDNFESLLPKHLRDDEEISLDKVVNHLIQSQSKTTLERGMSTLRDYAKKNLATFNILPIRRESITKRRIDFFYSTKDINIYLKNRASKITNINAIDFTYNFTDSLTGNVVSTPYEKLLFLIPEGSCSLQKTLVNMVIPSPISISSMSAFLGNVGSTSLFSKYGLLDENGEPSKLTTHMPRHTINTFLAIAGISEHLQAVIMGRVDITQNKHYQHLAIEERALSASIVSAGEQLDMFNETPKLPTNKDTHSNSSIDIIKINGSIGINPQLGLANGIAQNMHTFSTKKDKTDFFVDIFSTELDILKDMAEAFHINDSKEDKLLVVERHADLHPLDFGSCMRKLESWSCPYSAKCQVGIPCPYFTVTGRADEPHKLQKKIIQTSSQIADITELVKLGTLSQFEADEILVDLGVISQNLNRIKRQTNQLERCKVTINLLQYDGHKKPRTLASLFALEHRKKEAKS